MNEGTIEASSHAGTGASASGGTPDRVKALVVRGGNGETALTDVTRAMLEGGHEVVVAFDHRRRDMSLGENRALDELATRHQGFQHLPLPPRRDPWRIPASATRRALDYLRTLEPEQEGAEDLRAQARERAPRLLRALLVIPPFRWRFGRRMLAWMLTRMEAGMPIPGATKTLIKEQAPDVVVVSPGVELDSAQPEVLRSAHATRTPSVLLEDRADRTGIAQIRQAPTLTLAAGRDDVNDAVEAVGRAARTEEVPPPPGRLMRPLLWLLTPFLLILLPLLRPRATVRAVGRLRSRTRKRARAARRTRAKQRAERRRTDAATAKREKRARAEEAKQRKLSRAAEKQRMRVRREAGQRKAGQLNGDAGDGESQSTEPVTDAAGAER